MRCCCCDKKIEILYNLSEGLTEEECLFGGKVEAKLDSRPNRQERRRKIGDAEKAGPYKLMYLNATTGLIEAGYGSSHDGGEYIISICDDCLKLKVDSGIIAHIGDSLSSKGETDNRKIWRRNNNLDELL
jgi:hypothetical protein